jgi:hypothetical protein
LSASISTARRDGLSSGEGLAGRDFMGTSYSEVERAIASA